MEASKIGNFLLKSRALYLFQCLYHALIIARTKEKEKEKECFAVSKSCYGPKRALLKKSTFLNSTLSSILECALILFKILHMSRSRIISLQ